MLIRLTVENIAIITNLELTFQPGLNAITGETGSGKSLILDAIECVFSKRFNSKALLRHNAARGRIELTFDLTRLHNRSLLDAVLQDAGVEIFGEETELTLSRELTTASSRSRINGILVSLDTMEKLGVLILEIYGQHDLHSLFSASRQRDLLDGMGGEPLFSLRQEVRRTFREIQRLKSEMEHHQQQQADLERQRDFFSYQLEEIRQAELNDSQEDEKLQRERTRLSQMDTLSQAVLKSRHLIAGDDQADIPSISSLLSQVQKSLSVSTTLDPQFSQWYDVVGDIQERLSILLQEFEQFGSGLDTRPEHLQHIIDRLDTLEKLKRKHGGTLEAVIAKQQELEAALENCEQFEAHHSDLGQALLGQQEQYNHQAAMLSQMRQQIAATLEDAIENELAELMMPSAQFKIDIQPSVPCEYGQEQVMFMFSANPGEPLRPLAQVASGGELGRLMLALKITTAHADGLSTLILDEIDAGMSGITVRAIAEKLHALQHQCQLILVTHQPILAAKAPCHLHVQKRVSEQDVEVSVLTLTQREDRKAILSRLASGFEEDNQATAQFIEQLLA